MREENERALRESAASGAAARASANAPRGGTVKIPPRDPPTSVFAVAEGTPRASSAGFPSAGAAAFERRRLFGAETADGRAARQGRRGRRRGGVRSPPPCA